MTRLVPILGFALAVVLAGSAVIDRSHDRSHPVPAAQEHAEVEPLTIPDLIGLSREDALTRLQVPASKSTV